MLCVCVLIRQNKPWGKTNKKQKKQKHTNIKDKEGCYIIVKWKSNDFEPVFP